jgi:hypothetical protein
LVFCVAHFIWHFVQFSGFRLTIFCLLDICAGLLKVGVPKTWDESKKNLGYIRSAGIRQFISTYNRVKDLKGDELLWGDEIEYGIFHLDPENKKIRLSLRAKEVSDYDIILKIFQCCCATLFFFLVCFISGG